MNDTVKAAFWMTGCIASFSTMAVAGREVAIELDTFEIMMYRSLFGLIIVLAVGSAVGTLGQINRQNLGLHAMRNVFHFTGQNLWFFAVTVIPLAQVFALEFTTPLWVIVLSPLILGERLTAMRALAAVMGFCGILMVAQPDMQVLHRTAQHGSVGLHAPVLLPQRAFDKLAGHAEHAAGHHPEKGSRATAGHSDRDPGNVP